MADYTLDELKKMSPEERNEVLLRAVKGSATVGVRDKDGKPKYDDAKHIGTYREENLDA